MSRSSDAVNIRSIQWSEIRHADKVCRYDHVLGSTPIGTVLISWKDWKESPDFEVECPGGFIPSSIHSSLQEARESAQRDYDNVIKRCLDHEPVP